MDMKLVYSVKNKEHLCDDTKGGTRMTNIPQVASACPCPGDHVHNFVSVFFPFKDAYS